MFLFMIVCNQHSLNCDKASIKESQKDLMIFWAVNLKSQTNSRKERTQSPLLSFDIIVAATENFSPVNLLGKGGFGQVYKVSIYSITENH